MCTVTFIPVKDKYYLTSNRDEKAWRKQAVAPKQYTHDKVKLIYPKDAQAGGTWVAIHQNGNAAVLLNGAFIKHVPEPSYKKSRGIIFLEIITAGMPVRKFLQTELVHIEPFTIIILYGGSLYECRWDGNNRHCKQLEKQRPHIWSSATLYDKEIAEKREQWFLKWLNKNPHPNQQNILQFHQFAGEGDTNNDLLMNRNGLMLTVSVTGIEIDDKKSIMHYLDLKDNTVQRQEFSFLPSYALLQQS